MHDGYCQTDPSRDGPTAQGSRRRAISAASDPESERGPARTGAVWGSHPMPTHEAVGDGPHYPGGSIRRGPSLPETSGGAGG
jgi:hypothetical protein